MKNKNTFKQWFRLHGRQLLFLIPFIIVGGFLLWRSFAATEITYMRVMTWNTRYGGVRMSQNLDQAAYEIASRIRSVNVNGSSRDPDVVFLQEVYDSSSSSRNLIAKIAANLGMYYRFARTVDNVNYSSDEDGRYSRNGLNYGHAILSKLPVNSSEVIDLDSPSEARKAVKADIRVGFFGIRLVGAHLSSASQDTRGSYRGRQAEEIISRYGRDGIFTIFAGDTNTALPEDGGGPMQLFINSGFGGIYRSLPTIDSSDSNPDIDTQIDYILSRNLPANTGARTFRVMLAQGNSDHAALVTDYYLRR